MQPENTTIKIWKSDGTVPTASGDYSYTLASSTTYYAEFPIHGLTSSVHLLFDSAIIITSVEVEDSNFLDVTRYSSTTGHWVKEDPTGAEVEVVGNCTATGAVVAKTTGAAGGAMYHFTGLGAARARLKIIVGGTGGVARVAATTKG